MRGGGGGGQGGQGCEKGEGAGRGVRGEGQSREGRRAEGRGGEHREGDVGGVKVGLILGEGANEGTKRSRDGAGRRRQGTGRGGGGKQGRGQVLARGRARKKGMDDLWNEMWELQLQFVRLFFFSG